MALINNISQGQNVLCAPFYFFETGCFFRSPSKRETSDNDLRAGVTVCKRTLLGNWYNDALAVGGGGGVRTLLETEKDPKTCRKRQ